MELEIFGYLLSIGLAMIASVLGKNWRHWKHAAIEFAEALHVTMQAIKDDNVSKEELEQIIAEWSDVIESADNLSFPEHFKKP